MTDNVSKPDWWVNQEQKDEEANFVEHPYLDFKDGDSYEVEFLTNGKSVRVGDNKEFERIVFEVKLGDDVRAWFLNPAHWSTLKDLRGLGFPLVGRKAIITRRGLNKDTRYLVTSIPEKGE